MSTDQPINKPQAIEPSVENSIPMAEETETEALTDAALDDVAGGALSFKPALGITTTTALPISTG